MFFLGLIVTIDLHTTEKLLGRPPPVLHMQFCNSIVSCFLGYGFVAGVGIAIVGVIFAAIYRALTALCPSPVSSPEDREELQV